MIFGEDFGQLAASGEYEVYKSGTTIAQLNAAIASLSFEEYLDSFLIAKTDVVTSDLMHVPTRTESNIRMYMLNSGSSQGNLVMTQYWQNDVLYSRVKTIANGAMTITTKQTNGSGDTLLTLNSWTLYKRQKGYDVANGGSKVAYAIAPVQDTLSAANKNYAVGEQFLYDGHLYKVTSAITSGAQIVIGTNAEAAGSLTEQMITQSLLPTNPTNCSLSNNNSYYDGKYIFLNVVVTITTLSTNATFKIPVNAKAITNIFAGYADGSLVPNYLNQVTVNGDTVTIYTPKSKYMLIQCVVPRA